MRSFKALRRDYREERSQLQEIVAHDGAAEERQLDELTRRREAGEPVGGASRRTSRGG